MAFASTTFFVLVCFGIPLGVLAVLMVRNRRLAGVFGLGVLSFFVSQVVLRLPLLSALSGTAGFVLFTMTNPFLYMLLLAASASLFEETARLLLLRPQRKREFDLRVPLAFGIGHGGLEAFLTGASVVSSLIAYPGQMAFIGDALLLSGAERLSAMACHVAFTLLVYYSVMKYRPSVFGVALLLHALLDLSTGLVHYAVISTAAFELMLAAFAVVVLVASYRFASKGRG